MRTACAQHTCTACAQHAHGMCTACACHVHAMCMPCACHVHAMDAHSMLSCACACANLLTVLLQGFGFDVVELNASDARSKKALQVRYLVITPRAPERHSRGARRTVVTTPWYCGNRPVVLWLLACVAEVTGLSVPMVAGVRGGPRGQHLHRRLRRGR